MKSALTSVLLLVSAFANSIELVPQRVSENVYALIGPMAGRTYENYGLNANFGFIVTGEGVILIDSGATYQTGPMFEAAVRSVTDQTIRWVINTGSQDHRWLGNGYFAKQGAKLIALARTVRTQREFAEQQLGSLQGTLKDRLNGTKPVYAEGLPGNTAQLTLGKVNLELHWFGDAHFAGDAVVWLPQQKILFSGDLIYVDRMLSVLPWSRVGSWHAAFDSTLASLQPAVIVPGHGNVCESKKAQADTGSYLQWLLDNIRPAAQAWEGLDATVNKYGGEARWQYLLNYDLLHRGNINRSYVQFENNETGELP